ncbi:hypothetical protein AURDEDRAFT_130545 [Auricularia subglabra TFB-10046 SS5]|nr:hypothetical protein AURDEDRAFT_130545 [Auricularia subglabra TFB-10046 SS5]
MSHECATRLYREVLARSGSVGLDVRCPSSFGSPPPDAMCLYDLIRESMPRVRRLAIEYSHHSLLLQNRVHAPLLQALQLSSPESETDPQLPVQWIRNNAPRLRKLTACPLVLPPAAQAPPLRNITVLDVTMHRSPVRGDLRTLFLVFPRLERLSISGVIDNSLLAQMPPPPSMRAVCLGSCITVAFAALLAQWASGGGTQCALTLNTAPWAMALQWRNSPYCARLRQLGASELEVTLESEYPLPHEGMQGLRRGGDLSGLYSMKVEGVALSITLEMSEPAALALPGAATTVSQLSNWIMECLQLGSEKLQRIVIVQSKAPSAADVRALLAFAEKLYLDDAVYTRLKLRVPALQSITLEMSEPAALALPGAATTVSQLSNWIMECLQLGSEKLQRIVIVQSKAPSAADVRALLAFAEKLYLDDGAIT